MSEKEELLKSIRAILAKPADEMLDRQIVLPHTGAAEKRLPPEKRAELKARLERDIELIGGFLDQEAYNLALKMVRALVVLCKNGEYGVNGETGSGETDGLGQVLSALVLEISYLQSLND